MEALYQILHRYVRYLPIRIIVFIPDEQNKKSKGNPKWVNELWPEFPANLCMFQQFQIKQKHYNVTLCMGKQTEEVYQNGVYITNKYFLLSHDLEKKWTIPHLSILVDSPDFELPFGRHCISSDHVLSPLARKIRQHMLPRFFNAIMQYFEDGNIRHFGLSENQIEETAAALMYFDDNTLNPWYDFSLFRLVEQTTISFNTLQKQIGLEGTFFIEDAQNAGIDYSVFKVPVLKATNL